MKDLIPASIRLRHIFLFSFIMVCFSLGKLYAQPTITVGTGGTNISVDDIASWHTITNITLVENAAGQFSTGAKTITFSAPSGWEFNTAASSVTITWSSTAGGGGTSFAMSSSSPFNVTPTSTSISIGTVSAASTSGRRGTITIAGIQIRPTSTTVSAGGNIQTTNLYSSTLALGAYNSVAGAATKLGFTTAPASIVSGVSMTQPVVAVQDQFGNTVTGSSASITLTEDGSGSFTAGTNPRTASSGVATFSGIIYSALADNEAVTIGATSGSLTPAVGVALTASVVATKLAFQTVPTSVTSRSVMSSIVVEAQNADGIKDTGISGGNVVTISRTGSGSLSGTLTGSLSSGSVTFSNITYTAGASDGETFTLSATRTGGPTTATSGSISADVVASKLTVHTAPASIVSGVSMTQPVIWFTDAAGILDTNPSITDVVTVTEDGTGGLTSGTTAVAAVAGVVTYSGLIYSAAADGESVTFTFTDGTGGVFNFSGTPVTSGPLTANVVATKLAFQTVPTSVTSRSVMSSIVVEAQNADGIKDTGISGGNVVTISRTGSGSLSGTLTGSLSSGSVTFSNITYTAGASDGETFTLSATRTGGPTTATSGSISADVVASKLTVHTAPASIVSGVSMTQPVIWFTDAAGILDTNPSITDVVTVTEDGTGGLTSGTTAVAAVAGVVTYSGLIYSAAADGESVTFTFTDGTGGVFNFSGTPVTSGPLTANVVATKVVFTTSPANIVSHVSMTQPVVEARNAQDLKDVNYTGIVSLTENGAGAFAGSASMAAVAGVATFSGVIYNAVGDDESVTIGATGADQGPATGLTAAPGVALTADVVPTKYIITATGPYYAGTDLTVSAQLANASDVPAKGVKTVTWSKASSTGGSGSFLALTTATNSSGLATNTFTPSTVVGNKYTITGETTADALTGTSAEFTTVPGLATAYRITAATSTPTVATNDQLTITMVDQFQNTVTTYTGSKDLTFSGLGNAPNSTATPTVTNDNATPVNLGSLTQLHFSGGVSDAGGRLVAYKAEGPVTLGATDGVISTSGTGGAGASLTVSPGTVSYLTASPASSSMNVGLTNEITITARDAYGNVATSYSGSKTISFTGLGAGENIEGVTTPFSVTFTNGVSASGALTFLAAVVRSAVLNFSDGTFNTSGDPSYAANINITASSAVTNFLVEAAGSGPIGTQTAGSPFNIKITARDGSNATVTGFTGTVNLTTTAGTISPTVSASFVAGVLTSQAVTVTLAGTGLTITATKTGGAGETGTSNTFNVNPGTAAYLAAVPASGTMSTGQTNEITLTAKDANGNTATSYTGSKTISFTGLSGSETIEGVTPPTTVSVTFTSGVSASGALTFLAAVARSAALNFSDGSINSTGHDANITITVPINNFLVEAVGDVPIGTQTAGTPFNIKITARDATNATVTGFTGTVNLTTTAGTISPTVSASFVAGVLTSQAVTVTLSGTGKTITATKTGGTETGTSNTFDVNPGTATHLTAAATFPTMNTGATNEITISAKDANGNIATSYSGSKTISFTGLDSGENIEGVTTPISVTFTNGVSAPNALTFLAAVARSAVLNFSDGTLDTSGNPAYAANITITVSVANFVVEIAGGGVIGTQTAGTPFNIKITAKDAGNATVTGFTGTVNLSTTAGTISPTVSAAFVGGVLTSQAVTLTASGVGRTITATKTGGFGETGISNAFLVVAGTPTYFVATPAAAFMDAGTTNEITITARDANGNVATSYTGLKTITFSGLGAGETIEGSSTSMAVTFTNGVSASGGLTFTGLVVRTALLDFTEGSLTTTGSPAYGANINIGTSSSALSTFLVEASPSGAITTKTAGVPFDIKITARDLSNNIVTTFNGTVNLSTTAGTITPTVSGTFVNGVLATQTVTVTLAAAARSITATNTAGTETGTSNLFLVNAGGMHHLKATPANPIMLLSDTNELTLTACDAGGNTVTSYSGTKTISFVSGLIGGETIEGSAISATVSFTNGVSAAGALTFQPYFVRSAVLHFSDGTWSTTASTSYGANIIVTVPVSYFVVEAPGGVAIGTQTAGTAFNVRITAKDAGNNTVTGFIGKVNLSTTAGTIAPLLSNSFVSGVLTQSVTVTTATVAATITATNSLNSLETGISNAFTVNPGSVSYLKATLAGSTNLKGNNAISTSGSKEGLNTSTGTLYEIVLTAYDANGNIATGYSGAKTISFTGLAAGETIEGVTTPITVTFTNGVSPTGALTFDAIVARTVVLNFSDGTYGTSGSGSNALNIVITNPVASFLIEAAAGGNIGNQIAGTPFNIKITAKDVSNATVTTFTGTVNLTTNAGTIIPTVSASFVAGVLTSQTVTVTLAQTLRTITATNTSGTEAGTSNTFTVDAGPISYLKAVPANATMIANQDNEITLTAYDVNNNVAVTYVGSKSITVTGMQTGETIEGSATGATVNFTAGVSDAGSLTFRGLVLRNAVLNFSDGTYNTLGNASYAAAIVINTAIPIAPLALAATGITTSEFSANWSISSGATVYYLDVATDTSFTIPVSGFVNKDVGNVTTFLVTSLSGNTKYFYRVRASNTYGTSVNSNIISLRTLLSVPAAPVALPATNVYANEFTANWNPSVGATGYFLDVALDAAFTLPLSGYIGRTVGNVTTYRVSGLSPVTSYYYRVRAYNARGESANSGYVIANTPLGIEELNLGIPTAFKLDQNYPNPFNPSTNIRFALPKESFVTLKIYNNVGQEVAILVNQVMGAGNYNYNFDASKLSSGIYFYRIQTDGYNVIKKMILMK